MGMCELEEEQRRQMMERQKLDMLSAIAKSSDLTINQLRILNNRAQAPDDTASSVDIIDINKVADDIAAKEQAKRIQSDASLRQAQSSLEASLKRQSEVDPVQRMGQASGSSDVPDSGLMSGIKAEALMQALEASRIEKISTSDRINSQASKLLHSIKAKTINEEFNKSGLSNLETATNRDDKVLNIILSFIGYKGSALSIDDIVKMNYSGGTTWLEYYPVFVINKALYYRNILYKSKTQPEISLPETLNYMSRFDSNLEVPLTS
jgi:hypothetical protein